MKQLFIHTVAVVLVAGTIPVAALAESQDQSPTDNPELSQGAEMLNEGFRLLLEGLAKEVEPMADKWAEGWAELVDRIDEMNVYHPPETLPNGDIIIRRRIPLEPDKQGETDI